MSNDKNQEKTLTVEGSCGIFTISLQGEVLEVESKDEDYLRIQSFDLQEFHNHYGYTLEAYDILDLSGKTKTGETFKADDYFRKIQDEAAKQ